MLQQITALRSDTDASVAMLGGTDANGYARRPRCANADPAVGGAELSATWPADPAGILPCVRTNGRIRDGDIDSCKPSVCGPPPAELPRSLAWALGIAILLGANLWFGLWLFLPDGAWWSTKF